MQNEAHRQAILDKDKIIAEHDNAISDLKDNLEATKQSGDDAVQVASAANRSARAFRAKAEFLHRYLSYIEDPDPSGAMRKLFADHLCVLWRETQRDIHSVDGNRITFQQVARGSALSPAASQALAAAGIDQGTIEEYLELDRRRSQIQPQTVPFP